MKFLIRFVTTNAAGGLEQSDKHIETQILTIGRATDQPGRVECPGVGLVVDADGFHAT